MILYSQPGCPQCKMIHMLLDKKGFKYEENQDIEIMKGKGINHTPALETNDGRILQGKDIFTFVNTTSPESCNTCEIK